ncbi:kinetochore-associated protein NSL1 homolog [Ochotona curzoniae]|uniref:kinetochore-associated protein NSL1 homolog n=1 Tax=Ochotona curzoniae TaxID=130825 RepID=UPI001B353C26|nr:kinetochore-associated protein NSL1 homolog [Ochotona curzoniae]
MAGVPEGVVAAPASSGPAAASREDLRVRCTSKRAVTEVLELCGSLVQKLGDALPAEVREPVVRDLQWTFESAVQENVSINGQTWQEASDNCVMDSDIKMLEDQFDEVIVDLTTKRKQYPRKILECVVKTIKAQHEILKQYHPVVYPLDLNCDPDPAARMGPLKLRGEAIAKEISEAMKSLPVLIEQGDGFSQVLKMQPIIQLQRIHQEVSSSCHRRSDAHPENFIAKIESTPTEAASRKPSDVVLKRKRPADRPQSKWYPRRPKKIHLDTS